MAAITLKNIPADIHQKVKHMQLDLESKGISKSLEGIYLDIIEKSLLSARAAAAEKKKNIIYEFYPVK